MRAVVTARAISRAMFNDNMRSSGHMALGAPVLSGSFQHGLVDHPAMIHKFQSCLLFSSHGPQKQFFKLSVSTNPKQVQAAVTKGAEE